MGYITRQPLTSFGFRKWSRCELGPLETAQPKPKPGAPTADA
jgi:hypothetical protein